MSLQRKIADGLLRHDVSRNDRGSEMNFLSSQKQALEHHVIARAVGPWGSKSKRNHGWIASSLAPHNDAGNGIAQCCESI